MQIGLWLYVFLIVVSLILCAGLSTGICSEKVIRSADYATIFERGITAYNARDLSTAKDSFLCVIRSPDFRYKAYQLLGRMHKDSFMSLSTARLLLVKSLQSNEITKEEELSVVQDLVELYEKYDSMPLHYQFYRELLGVLQGTSFIDRNILPSLHSRQRLSLDQVFSCNELESFVNGSLSLLSSYLGKESIHFINFHMY
jgi:cellobiose-specific phosphotransferase system component IIB